MSTASRLLEVLSQVREHINEHPDSDVAHLYGAIVDAITAGELPPEPHRQWHLAINIEADDANELTVTLFEKLGDWIEGWKAEPFEQVLAGTTYSLAAKLTQDTDAEPAGEFELEHSVWQRQAHERGDC